MNCPARAASAIEGGTQYVCNRYYGSNPSCECDYATISLVTACVGRGRITYNYTYGGKLKVMCLNAAGDYVTKTKSIWLTMYVERSAWNSTVYNYGTYTV